MEQGGSAGYQRNPGVVGLYGKEVASLHGALRHILCLAMGHRRGVGFPRNQGNAQYKGLAEPAVDSGKSVFIAYPKADIDSNLLLFSMDAILAQLKKIWSHLS